MFQLSQLECNFYEKGIQQSTKTFQVGHTQISDDTAVSVKATLICIVPHIHSGQVHALCKWQKFTTAVLENHRHYFDWEGFHTLGENFSNLYPFQSLIFILIPSLNRSHRYESQSFLHHSTGRRSCHILQMPDNVHALTVISQIVMQVIQFASDHDKEII